MADEIHWTMAEYARIYDKAVTYAESHPGGHGSHNGWCRVAGIPLRAEDCPLCQAAIVNGCQFWRQDE